MTPHLEPCPFCGQLPNLSDPINTTDGIKWRRLEHYCPIVGLISVSWLRDQADIDRHWNHRAGINCKWYGPLPEPTDTKP